MTLTTSFPFALTEAIVFTGDAFVEGQAVLVQNGEILDLVPDRRVPADFQKTSCAGGILTPGFIDCQVNGGGNVLVNEAREANAILAVAAAHRKTGTTRLMPTCITSEPATLRAVLAAVRAARAQDDGILGLHFEGPHISSEKKGAHNAAFIRPFAEADLEVYRPQGDELFILTLAPENASPFFIEKLAAQGVLVSLGHSAAPAELVRAALSAGARGFTHLFNAMPPLGARDPSLVAVALDEANAYASLIGDQVHVAPEILRVAASQKERLFLVSDAMPPAGAETPHPFLLCGACARVQGEACVTEEGVLCGACLTLGGCVARCIQKARMDPERVLRMASSIPAAFLGRENVLGKLLPRYSADIVLLDSAFKAQAVWLKGVRAC